MGFPGGSEVKAFAWNAGDLGLIPGSRRSPGEGNGNPLQYSCKESDMTERLHLTLPLGVKSLCFPILRRSCHQAPLTFKTKCSGGSST